MKDCCEKWKKGECIDFGGWNGHQIYQIYNCPQCGERLEDKPKSEYCECKIQNYRVFCHTCCKLVKPKTYAEGLEEKRKEAELTAKMKNDDMLKPKKIEKLKNFVEGEYYRVEIMKNRYKIHELIDHIERLNER